MHIIIRVIIINDSGICLENLHFYEEAIQMYDKTIHFNPYFSKVYQVKG